MKLSKIYKLTLFFIQHTDKKASASIACFLAANGADLTIKNRKLQTPLDLCPDPNLCKTLVKCYNERKTDDMEGPSPQGAAGGSSGANGINENQGLDECLLCSDNKRDTIFKASFIVSSHYYRMITNIFCSISSPAVMLFAVTDVLRELKSVYPVAKQSLLVKRYGNLLNHNSF